MPTFNQIKSILSKSRVGIAGAGGLGSNCAAHLVRCGIGKLIIADYDVVSVPNLNRQFYFYHQAGMTKVEALRDNLTMINPDALVQMHNAKVTKENIALLFAVCDVVVEAFDDASEKEMFIEGMLELFPGKPVVAASGMAGWGRNRELDVVRSGNLYVCGDKQSEVSEENPPLSPRVNIVAAMQANLVLEILLNGVQQEYEDFTK